jgi:hypothetical protein
MGHAPPSPSMCPCPAAALHAPVLLHGASLPLPLPCVTAPFFLSPMIRGLLTEANRLPKTKKPQQGPRPPRPLAPPTHTTTRHGHPPHHRISRPHGSLAPPCPWRRLKKTTPHACLAYGFAQLGDLSNLQLNEHPAGLASRSS